jgi:endonuclease YncB( thermonuclease family)
MKTFDILGTLALNFFLLILAAKFYQPSTFKHAIATKNTTKEYESIWQVIRVSDGDTITVRQGNDERRIRFCGIDAPESSQSEGSKAKEFLAELISDSRNQVGLTFVERDRYDRYVAEVWLNPGTDQQQFANALMILAGYAWHYSQYSSNCPHHSALISAKQTADQNGSGIWLRQNLPPWEYRRLQRQ